MNYFLNYFTSFNFDTFYGPRRFKKFEMIPKIPKNVQIHQRIPKFKKILELLDIISRFQRLRRFHDRKISEEDSKRFS